MKNKHWRKEAPSNKAEKTQYPHTEGNQDISLYKNQFKVSQRPALHSCIPNYILGASFSQLYHECLCIFIYFFSFNWDVSDFKVFLKYPFLCEALPDFIRLRKVSKWLSPLQSLTWFILKLGHNLQSIK